MAGETSVVVVVLIAAVSFLQTTEAGIPGKLKVSPLDAMAMEQTDGWLGMPDVNVEVKAFMSTNDKQRKKSEEYEVNVQEMVFFWKELRFAGEGPWEKMQVTLVDRDGDEYGEGADDILARQMITFTKRQGTKKIESAMGVLNIKWNIKAPV